MKETEVRVNMFLRNRRTLLIATILVVICVVGISGFSGLKAVHAATLGVHTSPKVARPASGGSNEEHNLNSNLCLGVSGGSSSSGARLVQWSCNGNPDQQWQISFSFTNIHTLTDGNGKCLALYGGQAAIWQCNGNSDQQWAENTGNTAADWVNQSDGDCLAVQGGTKNVGAQVIVWPCNGNYDQYWY